MTDTRELALETFNEHALAGLAVGVVRDGELVETVSLGLADVAARKPVDADTVFRIGSISKTMTALAVMQLVEEGRIGLDDPVNERLRGYAVRHRDPSTPAVTVRHLLTHTSGLGELRRWSDLLRPTIGLGVKEGQPQPGLAEYYAPVLRAELPPGVKWAYANHGFATLGQLVADVSGRPFADHMRERLFEPLGMSGTDFLRTEGVRGGLAVGYQMKGKGLKPVKDREIAVAPAGSVFSTVREMALYVAALTGGGANEHGRAVSAETLVLMLTPQYEPDPRLASVGLSFMLERFGRHRVAGHDGGWPGFVS
ncbi:MAG: serine hydrolase domain-containing protein, partial [Gaiellaceae bacterium]